MSGLSGRRKWWIIPLLLAIPLMLFGWSIRSAVESAMMTSVAGQLKTVRDANVEALTIWLKSQERNVKQAAESKRIVSWAVHLIDLAKTGRASDLQESGAHEQLVSALEPWMAEQDFQGFVLLNRDWMVVGSTHPELIGRTAPAQYGVFLDPVFSGRATVSRPFPSLVMLPDKNEVVRAGVPTMYAAAPVREGNEVIGVLALRIAPEQNFTRILQVGKIGMTGETYAFDQDGLLLSESRFEGELKRSGLIPDVPASRSILGLTLKDPGVDLSRGERPSVARESQPLTAAVTRAIKTKEPGDDVDGYRDYFGIPSVGAWTWIDDYGFGVITEVNRDEAFSVVAVVRRMFSGLMLLLGLAVVTILLSSWFLARWQKAARQAVLAARQLGQYSLEEKIGSGGMGTVYRAHHAMLRRPTAVKLLDVERTNEASLRRFEREVQLTSQLNHPNTIAIYDFGRTPEGIFYYAMEYLDGINFHDLVTQFGPQPPGRVIGLLRQICGSLTEAHELGLIHRDIKPANLLVNRRGGLCDFVKVVDFGLVKNVSTGEADVTQANAITGTPMYMAPEAIERADSVDHRVDLYAVGAVGYFLLTGTTMFLSDSLFDLLRLQATVMPESPSLRIGKPVTPDLEQVIMSCLAKSPADRPQTARELEERLAACVDADAWTPEQAADWWSDFSAMPRAESVATATGSDDPHATVLVAELPQTRMIS